MFKRFARLPSMRPRRLFERKPKPSPETDPKVSSADLKCPLCEATAICKLEPAQVSFPNFSVILVCHGVVCASGYLAGGVHSRVVGADFHPELDAHAATAGAPCELNHEPSHCSSVSIPKDGLTSAHSTHES